MIDNSFVDTLHELAKDLFLSEYIENPELLILPPPEIADLTFKFSRRILKMICFELLVNAKKNRWIFSPGENFTVEGEILKGNKIWISFKKTTENNISIKIANTGPRSLILRTSGR